MELDEEGSDGEHYENEMKKAPSTKKIFGTANYLAPEILTDETHGKEVDFWALGVIIFELLVGRLPFDDPDIQVIYDNIINVKIDWPEIVKKEDLPKNKDAISVEAFHLIKGLLQRDPKERLGNKGINELKNLDFFEGKSFQLIRCRL